MVNIYDYDELLDAVENEIEKLRKDYPEQKELILGIRTALRYMQLALNLTKGRADATNIMLKKHLKENRK